VIAARYQSEGRADEYTTEQNTFRLLWPSGKHITPKLPAFIDFVVEYVKLENTHQ
jgi:DNA-binding transcriptional LysR family regulator